MTSPEQQQHSPATRGEGRTVRTDWGRLVLRIAIGGLLIIHGLQGLADPARRVGLTSSFGVPLPEISTWLSILGEIGTSVAVVAGLLTRVSALLMAVLMGTTWLVANLGKPLIEAGEPGLAHENSMFFGLAAVAVLLLGPGRLSFDSIIRDRLELHRNNHPANRLASTLLGS